LAAVRFARKSDPVSRQERRETNRSAGFVKPLATLDLSAARLRRDKQIIDKPEIFRDYFC
jgi:hypothetical protein